MASSRRAPTFDVFVGNLPADATEKNVGKLFTPFGEIGGIILKESAKAKGPNNKFAFVKYLCEPDADRACKELDRMKLSGFEIIVKKADDRKKGGQSDSQPRRNVKNSDTESTDSGGGGGGYAGTETDISGKKQTLTSLLNKPQKESPSPQIGTKESVLVTHVEGPVTVWLQTVNDENTKKIFNITEQLGTVCPAANPVAGMPEPNKIYACLFTEDGLWYRCQVKHSIGNDKYKVQYIDYGNCEDVPLSSLVEIPGNVSTIKGMANKIVLHNTRAKDHNDKQGIQFLKTLTDNQIASLVKTRVLTDGSGHYGQLFINGQSIADAVVAAGFGLGRQVTVKKPSGPQGDASDVAPGPQLMGPSMFGFQQSGPYSQQPPPPQQPQQQQQQQHQQQRNANSMPQPLMQANIGFQRPASQGESGKEKELQSELIKKRRELDKARNDKDAANLQLECMRTKVKSLQAEFASTAAKMQEETLSKRTNMVINLACKVRHLRDQFPTNKCPCLLETAIQLCTDDDRVDNTKCKTLPDVGSSLATYKAAQDEISKCKQQSELKGLIETRDEARRELHKHLSLCLQELESLPLFTRAKQVEEIQAKLVTTYSDYLKFTINDCPNMKTVISGFSTWKGKKDLEFSDVRLATDYSEGALQTALSQVKERLSVDSDVVGEKSEVDLDDLMKTYAHALQREINVTDLVHSKDATLVATVIASVRRELQSELTMLDNFRVLQQEFQTRRENIAPWLHDKPAFTDQQENRKTLRTLRSRLRHLVADKQDLEEEQSGSESELESLKKEEEKTRLEIQATLAKADNLMTDVALLADSNFPELIVQYPDLGIDSFLEYKGTVKSNRELDHYCLTSGFRPGIHVSSFNGEPVLIQEFHIGDSDHCSKDEFMKQVVSYTADTNIIRTVFFSKNERQAYIESSWSGGGLIEVEMVGRELTQYQLQQVCLQLVQQVAALHRRKVVHGEITPQALILREDNSVQLLYPDFSKTLAERVNKRYVTESGLVFQSPEVQYSSVDILGPAADIYNLVLLIFWLLCPSGQPSAQGSGSTSTKALDPSLQRLFDSVLSGKNATRLSADHLLQLDYFTQPIPEVEPEPVPAIPVFVPEEMAPAPHSPVIKSTDEPMEIGVFRAEDLVQVPVKIPASIKNPGETGDTDDSWTTKSSSVSSESRGSSPLEMALEAAAKSDTSSFELLSTVVEADTTSSDTMTSFTDACSTMIDQGVCNDNQMTSDTLATNGHSVDMATSGQSVENDEIAEQDANTGPELEKQQDTPATEENDELKNVNLKQLLSSCRSFLTNGDNKRSLDVRRTSDVSPPPENLNGQCKSSDVTPLVHNPNGEGKSASGQPASKVGTSQHSVIGESKSASKVGTSKAVMSTLESLLNMTVKNKE